MRTNGDKGWTAASLSFALQPSLLLFWVLAYLSAITVFFFPSLNEIWSLTEVYNPSIPCLKYKKRAGSVFWVWNFQSRKDSNGQNWSTSLAKIPVVRGQGATRPGQPGYITIHVCQQIRSIRTKRGDMRLESQPISIYYSLATLADETEKWENKLRTNTSGRSYGKPDPKRHIFIPSTY